MEALPSKRPKLRGVSTLEHTYEHGSFSEIFQVYSLLFSNEELSKVSIIISFRNSQCSRFSLM